METNTTIPGSRMENESADAWARRVYRMGWVPACGGTERPMMLRGRRVLYCVDLAAGQHAYIDLDSDMPVEIR